jgi:hypothetical protein
VARVDTAEYERINQYHWRAQWSEDMHSYYAVRSVIVNGKESVIMMQGDVLPAPDGYVTDHISRDTLDNRKINLRYATNSQNGMNAKKRSNNTSGHTGVSKNKKDGLWWASIRCEGELIHLGRFILIEDAIDARHKKEIELFGEFSRIHRDQ